MLLLIAFIMFAALLVSWVMMPETTSVAVQKPDVAPAETGMARA
jgi:hypothetical protein